jgi:hypothetical protein
LDDYLDPEGDELVMSLHAFIQFAWLPEVVTVADAYHADLLGHPEGLLVFRVDRRNHPVDSNGMQSVVQNRRSFGGVAMPPG